MYEYVFFDLDGTLTDPKEGITKSVAYALNKCGVEVEDEEQLTIFIGPPLYDSFTTFYNFSDELANLAIEYYRERYKIKGLRENIVYEGIPELLSELKKRGKKLVVATSKPELFSKQILEYFDLLKYFDFVSGATLDNTRTKKGDIIKYALDSLAIKDSKQVVMVGDRKFDILGAKEYQIDSIAVEYGYGNKDEFIEAGATYIVKKVLDILDLV